jgi:hypothetical protein
VFKKLKGHVDDFTKKDWDLFGITDLRITNFIEAGGSYFKPIASTAQLLENPRLEDALMQKTEFTQQEWDAFGVHGLRMHHFVQSGDSYFQPAGTEAQADVRVLRPIAHYGDFGEDGRLKWGVGDEVVVGEAFTVTFQRKDQCANKEEEKKALAKDTEGEVLEFNAEGAAKIAFREPVSAEGWVPSDQILPPVPASQRQRHAHPAHGEARQAVPLRCLRPHPIHRCVRVCMCLRVYRARASSCSPCLLDTLPLFPV